MAAKSDAVRLAGLTALGVSSGGLTVLGVRQKLAALENADANPRSLLFPTSHLLHGEFVVPPGSHAKKWVAIYAPNPAALGRLDAVRVCVAVKGRGQECFRLPYRAAGSVWGSGSASAVKRSPSGR